MQRATRSNSIVHYGTVSPAAAPLQPPPIPQCDHQSPFFPTDDQDEQDEQHADHRQPTAELNPLLPRKAQCDIPLEISPKDLLSEMLAVVKISLPLMAGYTLQQSINVASIISLGHMGATELASAALSSMFAGVTGYSVVYGLATALDTLCSQAVTGSDDRYAAGVWLQRGLLILTFCLSPVVAIWLHAEQLLLLLNQEAELARLSGLYLKFLLPGLVPVTIFECLKKFLQAQGIYHASTAVLLIAAPINAVMNYTLVWYPPVALGFIGAPIATSITQWLLPTLMVGYIYFVDGSQAWGGWTRSSLKEWGLFLKLGIPGMIMMCAEWWAWEIVALFASYLSTKELAAQSIVLTIGTWLYMIPLGISIGATNRLGNQLGARMCNRARLVSIASMTTAALFSLLNSLILVLFQMPLCRIFSDDMEVIRVSMQILPIAAVFQMCDGMAGVASGILRGVGKQTIGAIQSLMAYYVIALPVGLFLAFGRFHMRLPGIWIGLALGLLFSTIAGIFVIYRLDWREEVKRCMRRVDGGCVDDIESNDEDRSDVPDDVRFMRQAVFQANCSVPIATAYCVGAVLVKDGRALTAGFSRELPGNTHAEECCLMKLDRFADARGATIYTTMEPCDERLSGKRPCASRLIEAGVRRVVIGVVEPSTFIQGCTGVARLREAGIEVVMIEGFEKACLQPNAHVLTKSTPDVGQ